MGVGVRIHPVYEALASVSFPHSLPRAKYRKSTEASAQYAERRDPARNPGEFRMKTLQEIRAEHASKSADTIRDAYRAGVMEGLRTAGLIRAWLTSQPDRRWQKKVREMADYAITETKKRNGIE